MMVGELLTYVQESRYELYRNFKGLKDHWKQLIYELPDRLQSGLRSFFSIRQKQVDPMKITQQKIPVRKIVDGYKNHQENGITAYHGRLYIGRKYQRILAYNEQKRNAVIKTIKEGFPLNTFYWSKNKNSTFDVVDGQQRLISICEYVQGSFSVNGKHFYDLKIKEQNTILDYLLIVYVCDGDKEERLKWFKRINTPSTPLTAQELRNALYPGKWLTDAKRYFSKKNCAAYNMAHCYMTGSPIKQDYLETVLKWINFGEIEEYMAVHQDDPNADELWLYFENVINWVRNTFPYYRKEMKGVEWGQLYNKYCQKPVHDFEERLDVLMRDQDVTNKKGIYNYLFSGNEENLCIRAFSKIMEQEAYHRQQGICPKCQRHFKMEQMDSETILSWSNGGHIESGNCQLICKECKSSEQTIKK